MARAADVGEKHAALFLVGFGEGVGVEARFPLRERGGFFGGVGCGEFAPDGGEFFGQRTVVVAVDLAGEEDAEVVALELAGGDGVERERGPRGARDERGDDGGALVAVELRPLGEEHGGDGGVVAEGEAAGGVGAEVALVEHRLADLAQPGRAGFDEGFQRDAAEAQVGGFVQRDDADFVERAAIAERGAEVAEAVAERLGGVLGERGGGAVPRRGLGDFAASDEAVGDAVEHGLAAGGRGIFREAREHGVEARGGALDFLGEPPRAETLHAREPRFGDEFFKRHARRARERLDAGPQHERQIVVGVVLRVREQRGGKRSALRGRQRVHKRGEREADECARLFLRESRELLGEDAGETRGARGVRVALVFQQPHGPRAHGFVAIGEQRRQQLHVAPLLDVQRP